MDDPIHTYDFIKNIINERPDNIVGVAVAKGNRLTLSKGKSKIAYILSLLIIMGPIHFFMNSLVTIRHKIYGILHKFSIISDPSILGYANSLGIRTFNIDSPNESAFIDTISTLNIDLIINQSQCIIKKKVLSIPKLGVINRHNALLPKNRGRLTPFWVLSKNEMKTGVSIHFVEESLDSGDIIAQRSYDIEHNDTFNSLVKKNYILASELILEALDKLENGNTEYIINDNKYATYNSTPSIKDALKYRVNMIIKFLRINKLFV